MIRNKYDFDRLVAAVDARASAGLASAVELGVDLSRNSHRRAGVGETRTEFVFEPLLPTDALIVVANADQDVEAEDAAGGAGSDAGGVVLEHDITAAAPASNSSAAGGVWWRRRRFAPRHERAFARGLSGAQSRRILRTMEREGWRLARSAARNEGVWQEAERRRVEASARDGELAEARQLAERLRSLQCALDRRVAEVRSTAATAEVAASDANDAAAAAPRRGTRDSSRGGNDMDENQLEDRLPRFHLALYEGICGQQRGNPLAARGHQANCSCCQARSHRTSSLSPSLSPPRGGRRCNDPSSATSPPHRAPDGSARTPEPRSTAGPCALSPAGPPEDRRAATSLGFAGGTSLEQPRRELSGVSVLVGHPRRSRNVPGRQKLPSLLVPLS